MSPSNPSTQSSVNSVEDGMKNLRASREDTKETHFLDTAGLTYHAQGLHRSKPDMVPVLREGTQVPPLARSYLQMIIALKRNNYFLE